MSSCSIKIAALLGIIVFSASDAWTQERNAQDQTVWKFDNLSHIGGMAPKVEGNPLLVDSPVGKAVQFNGKDTGLFFPARPLVGAKTFTIEAIFRPEGGDFQQRWMHIAETDPKTGLDANPGGTSDPNPRFMFEVRVVGDQWYLDAFVNSAADENGFQFWAKLFALHDKFDPVHGVHRIISDKERRCRVRGRKGIPGLGWVLKFLEAVSIAFKDHFCQFQKKGLVIDQID